MCSKLCSIYQRTVIIAIYVVRPFIGWPIELHCLNIFLILLQFGKENEKNNEFNQTFFFLCCICWDCSFSIAEFSISQSCLCLHFFTVYKQDNQDKQDNIMANGSFQQFREYRSQSYTCNQKTPLTKYLTDKIVQFFYYIFFSF